MTSAEYNISVDNYADSIYRFIVKNINNTDKAKDIVQDTFEKLWLKKENVAPEKVKSYLFTTAYHTLIDVVRREKHSTSFDSVNYNHHWHTEQYTDLNEVLHAALKQLPEIQRSVIMLRDYEGYTYDEIGQITGLTEAQVKVYIYRGRNFLKEYIGKLETVI